jgi:hypothetical protein
MATLDVRTPADVTPEWLTSVLGGGPVAAVRTERIGTWQMSECHRLEIDYADPAGAGPRSLVLKVAAADEQSRQTGVALGLYEREVRFYNEVAPLLGGPLAHCHHGAYDEGSGTFSLLLADAGPAVQGDEIAGADLEHARLAMGALGRLHGPAIGSASLAEAEWLNRDSPLNQALVAQLLAGFLERYTERIAPEHRAVCERLAESFDAYQEANAPGTGIVPGLVHGDYRLDNLLFGQEGADRPLTVVDWQTVGWGPAMTDVAYFLGSALTVDDRRRHADELLATYHEALGPEPAVSPAQVRDGVRTQSFFGVMMAIISPMLVERTERGDDMFMTVLARHAQQVLDLDALAVLPAPSALEILRPDEADEAPHEPEEDPLWNESWYFDVADGEQGVGAYVRLGLTPNLGHVWYSALICGPGRPTIAVLDFDSPVPEDRLVLSAADLQSELRCEAALREYRVTLRGRGEAHDDPAALLRGESGAPVDVELDLVWETAGEPYRYRMATRYEIPCRVSGTLRAGDEAIAFAAAPGQRDHSWGRRDWWSMDWVWSAAHLDDGTHVHGLDLRIPGMPRMGAGYVQEATGEISELASAEALETMDADGLPGTTRQTFGDLETTFEPAGHGPLRLTAEDGRVALFPRAWCRVSTADGRTGVGWMEWNLNVGA